MTKTTGMTTEQTGIGVLAREFGVTTRAIRFYEEQGLLAPVRQGQSRFYTPRERTRLKLILRGKRLGFSLEDIGEMLDLYEAPEGEAGQLRLFIEKMRERRSELEAQRRDLEQVLDELSTLEQRCLALLEEGENGAESRRPLA
ncbi:MAG: MerR family transcriptional regulator [Gammaproteobacteria bacterium]